MGKSIYQYFEHQIAAGEIYEVAAYGRFLKLISNSGATDILVTLGENHKEQRFPQGISVQLADTEKSFTLVRFRNDTVAAVTIKFCFSAGIIYYDSVTVSGELNVDPSTDTIETPAKLTATNVAAAVSIAAEATQREIILNNQSANTIWYGDANVDGSTGRGIELPPFQRVAVMTSSIIYFHAPAGNSDLSIMRLKK